MRRLSTRLTLPAFLVVCCRPAWQQRGMGWPAGDYARPASINAPSPRGAADAEGLFGRRRLLRCAALRFASDASRFAEGVAQAGKPAPVTLLPAVSHIGLALDRKATEAVGSLPRLPNKQIS